MSAQKQTAVKLVLACTPHQLVSVLPVSHVLHDLYIGSETSSMFPENKTFQQMSRLRNIQQKFAFFVALDEQHI